MAQNHRTNVPEFGNWEEQGNVPYTVFFEKARKKRGTKMINPNNPQENPGMFPPMSPPSVAPRPSLQPRPNTIEPIGRAAVRPTGNLKPIGEQDIHLRQFSSSTAYSENADQRINGNESNRGSRGQRPVRAAWSSAGFDKNLEHFPGNNQQVPAKASGKGSAVSTGWNDSAHGGSVGKFRQRPSRGDGSVQQFRNLGSGMRMIRRRLQSSRAYSTECGKKRIMRRGIICRATLQRVRPTA